MSSSSSSIVMPVNLIINFLPDSFTSVQLHQLFQTAAGYIRCNLVKEKETGQSLCYGFVMIRSPSEALNVCSAFDGISIHSVDGLKRIKVSLARPNNAEFQDCKLFIQDLPHDWSEPQLNDYFTQFGSVVSCKLLRGRYTGISIRKAYVLFSTNASAHKTLDFHVRNNTGLRVGLAGRDNRVDRRWTEADVKEVFGHLGRLVDCHVVAGDGNSPSTALLRFH